MEVRRGQAAMEYLMTYGWALLVIVLVLGALLYLGVLNPQSRIQDTCNLPIGWECKVMALDGNGKLTLKITNQQAVQAEVNVACAPGTGTTIENGLFKGTPQKLSPGASANFYCTIAGFNGRQIGEISSGEVFVKYKEDVQDAIEKTIKGSYTAKVSVSP